MGVPPPRPLGVPPPHPPLNIIYMPFYTHLPPLNIIYMPFYTPLHPRRVWGFTPRGCGGLPPLRNTLCGNRRADNVQRIFSHNDVLILYLVDLLNG